MLKLFIVLVLFSLVFLLAEILYALKVAPYITRKVAHVGSGFVAASLPYFVDFRTTLGIGVVFFLVLAFSKGKKLLRSIHEIDEDSIGAVLFPLSIAATAFVFWNSTVAIFQWATLVLGVSDGIAGVVGRRFGKRTFAITGKKTVEGSLFFFLSAFLILLLAIYFGSELTIYKVVEACVGAAVLCFIEAFFGKGWDNLFIPLAAGAVLFCIL
ncbi:MAG: hypothetical protein WCP97_08760 [bacterium]